MIRDAAALVAAGLARPEDRTALDAVGARYAVAITPTIQSLIRAPDDPIGRQFVPDPAELHHAPHELPDPIGDDALSPVPGIVHRYPDRALLKPLLVCPVYCRFCFRREHVGPGGGLLTEAELEAAYAYLRAQPGIREVILTGGDPLMLSPRRLGAILDALAAIPHVELLRIHTRVPLAEPGRVTAALAAVLDRDIPVWVAVHANHAREFTPGGVAALRRLGVPLLGQTVLLRGVNDSAEALEALFRTMLRARVKPYYLHQLDPAPGTARFAVPIGEGQRLLRALRGRVTGLAWPTYVLDIPGGFGKVPIGPGYLDGGMVADPFGQLHPRHDTVVQPSRRIGMDPITAAVLAVLPALAADTVKAGIKDAYDGLKAVIHAKWGEAAPVSKAIHDLEQRPSSAPRAAVLDEEAGVERVSEDAAVQAALKRLTEVMTAQGLAAPATGSISVTFNQGTQTGNIIGSTVGTVNR